MLSYIKEVIKVLIKKTISLQVLLICIILVYNYLGEPKDKIDTSKPFQYEVLNLLENNYRTVNVTFPKNSNPSTQIQKALNVAKDTHQAVKVIIPPGDYVLDKPLHIYSYTWLQASSKTIFRKSAKHKEIMLLNGDFNASYHNYDGNSNIIIDGGTWDAGGANPKAWTPSTFGFAHGQNILIQNTIIKNMVGGHAIDSSGNKNIIIRNNKFLGTRKGTESYTEAIQIDGMVSEKAFRRFGSVDLTVTKNMLINNNYFGNSHVKGMKPWGVGVGSHSAAYNTPYTNIKIINNTFDGMTYSAIKAYNWSKILIKSNNFIVCKQEILIKSYGSYYYIKDGTNYHDKGKLVNSDIVIIDNKFN